jgi:hypothetical protein
MLMPTRALSAFWRQSRRQLLASTGALTILTAMQSGVAAANTLADPNLSADQARAIFLDAGYQVDQLRIWDWLSPPVRTFQVHDLARNRLLLVQVYPDIPEAQLGSERMIEGYSTSTWIDNLALFEANADDYQRVMTTALARNLGMVQPDSTTDVVAASAPIKRVDVEYTNPVLDALPGGPTALAGADRGAAQVVLAGG